MKSLDGSQPLIVFSCGSTVAADLPPVALRRLAQMSWTFNARMGVTGLLRVIDGRFEQVIEGPAEVILRLAARILADPRHEAITIGQFHQCATRRFSGWTAEGFGLEAAPTLFNALGQARIELAPALPETPRNICRSAVSRPSA